mmetsp:Transcript_117426/g.328729  ORF Transcript_117426/g.328729 Transcript_117426/m.328729 type:complete len:149 (+) Transcript_117426:101-547(+)
MAGFRLALLAAVASAALASAEPVGLRGSTEEQGEEAAAVAAVLVNKADVGAESDALSGRSQWSCGCNDAYDVCSVLWCYHSSRCFASKRQGSQGDATPAEADAQSAAALNASVNAQADAPAAKGTHRWSCNCPSGYNYCSFHWCYRSC